MALSDIIEKIKSEANVKAQELKADFDKRKAELEKANVELLTQLEKESNEKMELNSSKIKEKAGMEAEMDAKNNLLKAKREFIDATLVKAAKKLAESGEYENLLAEMLKKTDLEMAEVVAAKGKEEETKRAIQRAGKQYTLATGSADFAGGFILKTPKVEIDNSFETIINNQLRANLEIDLNKMLFV